MGIGNPSQLLSSTLFVCLLLKPLPLALRRRLECTCLLWRRANELLFTVDD
jgi:hypothetical protein